MLTSVFTAVLLGVSSLGVAIPKADIQQQNEVFQRLWGTDFVWKFDDLPAKGGVTEERIPYSGSIYLDKHGGTVSALRKYDRAFHGGRPLATAWEQWDTTAYQQPVSQPGGLFGRRQVTRIGTPNWHGHCNGWTAATIRHAEPQQSVTRNGVVFTPADIKGLLADLYIYNHVEDLSGSSGNIQAGLFHAVVANWLGRGGHPLGMEADPGPEKWNYPAFTFNSTSAKRSERQVEVKLNLVYAKESQGEYQKSPRIQRTKSFHYRLDLNAAGEITGGQFYGDSSRIDMLWVPLLPKPSKQPGHERGNPHINVDRILAIWRDSVPEETRKLWLVADPAPEDRVLDAVATRALVPVHHSTSVAAVSRSADTAAVAPTADSPAAAEGPVAAPAALADIDVPAEMEGRSQ
jgi:hypothetical protein